MQIPQDDLMDVMEMTSKIEAHICKVLKNNDCHLAMPALMSATINCLFAQCHSLDEVIFYRNLFIKILDKSIQGIEVVEPPKE